MRCAHAHRYTLLKRSRILWGVLSGEKSVKEELGHVDDFKISKQFSVLNKLKDKGAGLSYSLISSLNTYHLTLHFTPLVTGPAHSCAISTPWRAHSPAAVPRIELIVYITISVLPETHFQMSQVKHLRVFCPRTQHLNNAPRLRG